MNIYIQFLFECMKIDCQIDCDARGRQLRSCLGHQITQSRHCVFLILRIWPLGEMTNVNANRHSVCELAMMKSMLIAQCNGYRTMKRSVVTLVPYESHYHYVIFLWHRSCSHPGKGWLTGSLFLLTKRLNKLSFVLSYC